MDPLWQQYIDSNHSPEAEAFVPKVTVSLPDRAPIQRGDFRGMIFKTITLDMKEQIVGKDPKVHVSWWLARQAHWRNFEKWNKRWLSEARVKQTEVAA